MRVHNGLGRLLFDRSHAAAAILTPRFAMGSLVAGFCLVAGANAMYWQDGAHPAGFFAQRPTAAASDVAPASGGQITRIVFDSGQQMAPTGTTPSDVAVAPRQRPRHSAVEPVGEPSTMASAPTGDTELHELQALLAQLGFYDSDIDGKIGPMTRQAMESYKKSAGLEGIDLTIGELIASARNNLMVTAAIPVQRPQSGQQAPRKVETVVYQAPGVGTGQAERPENPASASPNDIDTIILVQKALRQYAGDEIVVDGVMGSKTRQAISEFQSVFRMEVTGRIDEALLTKLRDVGLI